jgi:hypothetical protein
VNLNFPNRRMRTRTSGGVGGVRQGELLPPLPDPGRRAVSARAESAPAGLDQGMVKA